MTDYFGPKVGRFFDVEDRVFNPVFQPNTPIQAEEINLLMQTEAEERRRSIHEQVPSGWISDPSNPKADFFFDKKASNLFWLGNPGSKDGYINWAVVNGWTVPVAGTLSSDLKNAIQLPPPPPTTSSSDVNFVFLEVWKAMISPDGNVNKPSDDRIYRFGNVEYGGTNLDNQMLDPRVQKETSERVQLQYRIRVIEGVDPQASPYGFNSSIKAQGPLDNPTTSNDPAYQYANMGEELGDPGLWRAGVENQIQSDTLGLLNQSQLETVDGFVYAVPICMVFRRTAESWGVDKQSGGFDRNPSMTDRSQAEVLPTVALTADIGPDDASISVDTSLSSTKFPANDGLIKVDDEIISYSSWSGSTITVDTRGAKDTHPTKHASGKEVTHVTGHPEGLFSDEIEARDVYDLRHVVNFHGVSSQSLLQKNFHLLLQGKLRTQWKKSLGDVKGTKHYQVDYFSTSAPSPAQNNYVYEKDAPDGFRKVFSDAASLQPGNLLYLNTDGTDADSTEFGFNPIVNVFKQNSSSDWRRGDMFRVPVSQYRATFGGDEKVRFVHPLEYREGSYKPFQIWFSETHSGNATTGLQQRINPEFDDASGPRFAVFGKKPEDLDSSYITSSGSTNSIDFDSNEVDITNVNFSDTPTSLGGSTPVWQYLVNEDAYLVVEDTDIGYQGAFEITGSDGGTGLTVVELDGSTSPGFAVDTKTANWYIRLQETTEADDDAHVVLYRGFTNGDIDFSDQGLYMSYGLLYHPNQGLTFCPEEGMEIRFSDDGGGAYLRQNTFQNVESDTVRSIKKAPVVPMEFYPHTRTDFKVRGNDLTTDVEGTWSEAYIDKGSKTLVFQPVQSTSYTAGVVPLPAAPSYQSIGTTFDFNLGTGQDSVMIPGDLIPPMGRVDVPFLNSTAGPDDFPYGINAILVGAASSGGDVPENSEIIQNRMLAVYDPINLTPGDYNTTQTGYGSGGAETAMVCRFYDKGGVRGIELPPHFGISRLFGVYELSDYNTNDSEFVGGSNGEYRQKKSNYQGQNLLRTDTDRRSLIITDENTFVIPEDVIDESFLNYSSNPCGANITGLGNGQFIVEFAGFMFEDWQEDLVRFHVVDDYTPGTTEASIRMLTYGPTPSADTFNAISKRTPYQGNVNGTMPTSTTSTTNLSFPDYSAKPEADEAADFANATSPIDRRKSRLENPARLHIMAAIPFVTSLGTGIMSGPPTEGSYNDIGYLDQTEFPDITSARKVKSRALECGSEPVSGDLLNGMTERLPAGLLASDHLLLGEGLNGDCRRFWTTGDWDSKSYMDYDKDVPLPKSMIEGDVIFSDGTSGGNQVGVSFDPDECLYRTYRGGVLASEDIEDDSTRAGAFVMSGPRVFKHHPYLRDFSTEYIKALEDNGFSSLPADELEALKAKYRKRAQIHGAVMFGVACLVTTQKEEVTDNDLVANYGGEAQMLVATGTSFGKDLFIDPLVDETAREYLDLIVQQRFDGVGELYASADRFRLEGRPLIKGVVTKPESTRDDVFDGIDPFFDEEDNQ